jgi:phosphonate transport system permease protein
MEDFEEFQVEAINKFNKDVNSFYNWKSLSEIEIEVALEEVRAKFEELLTEIEVEFPLEYTDLLFEDKRSIFLDGGIKVVEPLSSAPLIILMLLVFSVLSWIMTDVNLYNFFTRFSNLFTILKRMVKPNWEYIEKVVKVDGWSITGPLIDTIQMSFLGSIIGSAVALPIAIISSSNINKFKPLLIITRLILSVVRTLPVLVYAAIFAYITGFGTVPGVLAITIFTFAIVSKMLYEKIETIDMGAYTAIEATGATKTQAFFRAVIPQIMGSYLSLTLYSFEINIRYAAILGYVGAGGIGILLQDRMNWLRYDDVVVVLLVLFLTVLAIENLSRYLRRRLG